MLTYAHKTHNERIVAIPEKKFDYLYYVLTAHLSFHLSLHSAGVSNCQTLVNLPSLNAMAMDCLFYIILSSNQLWYVSLSYVYMDLLQVYIWVRWAKHTKNKVQRTNNKVGPMYKQ